VGEVKAVFDLLRGVLGKQEMSVVTEATVVVSAVDIIDSHYTNLVSYMGDFYDLIITYIIMV